MHDAKEDPAPNWHLFEAKANIMTQTVHEVGLARNWEYILCAEGVT